MFVRHNDGIAAIDNPPADVAALKAAVHAKTHLPPEAQVLTFAGKVIDDAHTISSYGIVSGTTIHLAVRGRGGAPTQSSVAASALHCVDKALERGEHASALLQTGLDVAEKILKVGTAVPLLGPVCAVAKDILGEVRASADRVDDVLEAGRRAVDTLKTLEVKTVPMCADLHAC